MNVMGENLIGCLFISRFCFSNMEGHGPPTVTLTHAPNLSSYWMALYIRSDTVPYNMSWHNVQQHIPGTPHPWSCNQLERSAVLRRSLSGPSGKTTADVPVSQRAYYMFLGVGNCADGGGISLPNYRVEFLNPGGLWYRQFSYDEQGIGPIYIFFFVAYAVLLAVHGFGVWRQMKTEQWHPIIRILSACIAVQLLSCLAMVIHYSIYANDGIGAPGLQGLGTLLDMASTVVLMFLLILLAKGWAITTSYLAHKNVLIVVLALFILAYLALFIWDYAGRDPASTLYFYESWPGIIVLVLRFATWLWFLWCLRGTIRLESLPEKRTFYFVFGGCYSLWFISLPIFVLVAFVTAPEYRFRTVTGLATAFEYLVLTAFAFLLWPSRASNYFVIKASPQLLSVNNDISPDSTNYGSTAAEAYDDL